LNTLQVRKGIGGYISDPVRYVLREEQKLQRRLLASQRMPNSCALVAVIPAMIEQEFFAGLFLSLLRALKFFSNSLGWAAQ
jgi:hypothetical protein